MTTVAQNQGIVPRMDEKMRSAIDAFYKGATWTGVSCIDYFWPFTASRQGFEARRAIGQMVCGLRHLNGQSISVVDKGEDIDVTDVLQVIRAAELIYQAAGEALNEAVAEAVARGATWKQVGDSLGVLRTAAQKRFKKGVTERRATEIRNESLMCATVFANWAKIVPLQLYDIDEEDFKETPPEVWVDHSIRKYVQLCVLIFEHFESSREANRTNEEEINELYKLYGRLRSCFQVLMLRQSFDVVEEYARKAAANSAPWVDENASTYYLYGVVRLSVAFDNFTRMFTAFGDGDQTQAATHLAYVLANAREAQRTFTRPEITNLLAHIEQEIVRSGNSVYGVNIQRDAPSDANNLQMEIFRAIWKNDKARMAEMTGVQEIEDPPTLEEMLGRLERG